ncbi:NupC/NupG family nucleoside CNT transporter [Blochmannia endosymbiont of Polyrhachis (Hedomyrma) turneri]|uniref:NupC/NupG family nucleoside CNT transporter n=1 Tax=Blochmannia endosymbiont of Polyrhachis (Hedomyrma) turneri TaxID=1505596 RepID=UPI00061A67E4|nr:nucleoside transporter C-terminal domain-containing protein [Blochmannia endosymbiont of Polyrhachis (Hedomyrma) turneri]AKC60065.1 Nucleoside permease nupC [Blochmannia endosymbiont of Polyrhachis (Hedomyrma) turneri]
MSQILHFIFGLITIILLALIISKNPKKIQIRFIIQILTIEIIFAYLFLDTQIGLTTTYKISNFFNTLLIFAKEGIDFVFGNMNNAELAFFFLNVLCPIIFISSLIGILKHMKILSILITSIGYLLSKINGMGKLESFNAVSSLIFGQTENFIAYKDILTKIPKQRMYTMATTAMSTASMAILGVYMNMLNPKYVVIAVILNMFSAFIILSLSNPYQITKENDLYILSFYNNEKNIFEILQEYIYTGLKITIIITAMLIGFIALIHTINAIFNTLFHITLQDVIGYIFIPCAWIIGIPEHECFQVARIMATKLITNEFIAIIELQKISETLSTKSIGILSVFLVSFANFSSIGIIVGAIKGLNEKQAKVISHYGLKLLYNAILINLLSANIIGLVIK